jgi:hypothetical protein
MCVHQIGILSLYTKISILSVDFIILITKLPVSSELSNVNMSHENAVCHERAGSPFFHCILPVL